MLHEGAARRGHNLGSAGPGLLRLVGTWASEAVEQPVVAAVAADALHIAAVRQTLERRAEGSPPPFSVTVPEKVKDVHVRHHALSTSDLGGEDDLRPWIAGG